MLSSAGDRHEAGKRFDVIVVGGGIAGSILAGVLARSGLGVLVLEKEERFRDRVRGEATWPYGVADARRLGVEHLLKEAGGIELTGMRRYEGRQAAETFAWESDSIDGAPERGFSHVRLQEAAFAWAAEQGATMVRSAKAVAFARNGVSSVTVAQGDCQSEFAARLVVGADGKHSKVRHWTGGETVADPEHHRFGGVLLTGVRTDDRDTDNFMSMPNVAVNWFAVAPDTTRLYLRMPAGALRASGADRSLAALLSVAAEHMPEGALADVQQAGPIGFFANNDIWASRVASEGVVLIGDAAGAPDPTQGHGTALLFHDVRVLSELLLDGRDWGAAIAEFATRRCGYYAAVRAYDRWHAVLGAEEGDMADRLRDGHKRAKDQDPTLGGFALIAARGPDGLVADEGARRRYFGEDLV